MNIETQKQNRQIGMLVQDFTSQVVDFYNHIDIVNIGLHFILKNVRPYAASCSEA